MVVCGHSRERNHKAVFMQFSDAVNQPKVLNARAGSLSILTSLTCPTNILRSKFLDLECGLIDDPPGAVLHLPTPSPLLG
jgi:hypothetical protein